MTYWYYTVYVVLCAVPVPPLVMEMQTGSTNYHISQIFFVFAAPMYWWNWLAAPN
jgi:hypothetical protein